MLGSHVLRNVPQDQSIQPHDEWTTHPAARWTPIFGRVLNAVIGVQSHVGVKPRKGHIMEDAACSTCSGEICWGFKLLAG
ncbi:MAG: hypothetical protein Q9170_006132 [Blastenia crenularia]